MALLLVALLLTRHTLANTKDKLAACTKHGIEVQASYDQFQADVRAKTAAAKAADAAHAAQVETAHAKATTESQNDIEKQLAAARARYDALRLHDSQQRPAQARPSGGGGQTVPEAPNASSGAPGAREATILSAEDELACTEAVIKAQGWQDWWKQISAVPN